MNALWWLSIQPPLARGGKWIVDSVHDLVCVSAHVIFAFNTTGLLTAAPGALGGRLRQDSTNHTVSAAGHANRLELPHGEPHQGCAAAAWAGSLSAIPVETLASEDKAL